MPSHENEVDSPQFFIDEQHPTEDYALLYLASLSAAYSTHSLAVGLCGVTTEQVAKEREDEEQFIFPVLDRILVLSTPDANILVSSIANAHWMIKEEFTGSYAGLLEEQFLKIRDQETNTFKVAINRVDAVLSVLCNGKRSNTV